LTQPSNRLHGLLRGCQTPFFDRPAAREHAGATRPELAVGDPDAGLQAAADSAARAAGDESSQLAGSTAVVDDFRSTGVDARLAADALAEPHSRDAADLSCGVVLAASGRTQPQLAADAYPEPLTGEVLAAGRVKPRTPDRTAPAAVRSAGLATAARAAHTSSGGQGR
jgi:hypothetical protein